MRLNDNGYLGIGTTTPDTSLHIFKNSFVGANFERDAGAGGSVIKITNATGNYWISGTQNEGDNDSKYVIGYNSLSMNDVDFVIDTSGNIGIGTTTPEYTVLSNSKVVDIGGANGGEIVLDHYDAGSTSDIGVISFARDNNPLAYIRATADGATDSGKLRFWTKPTGGSLTERLTIDSSGYVGIGTTTPEYPLDILGSTPQLRLSNKTENEMTKNAKIVGRHYLNTEEDVLALQIYSDSTKNAVRIGGTSSGQNSATQISFYTGENTTTTSGTRRMIIDSSGNVGIGTDSPIYDLHVQDDTATANIGVRSTATNASLYLDGATNNDAIVYFRENTDNRHAIYSDGE
jgi:hypothetical protein